MDFGRAPHLIIGAMDPILNLVLELPVLSTVRSGADKPVPHSIDSTLAGLAETVEEVTDYSS